MYSQLSEHLNCTFVGTNSPIVLRFEADTETGGMSVEEYEDGRPVIKLHGDVADAKLQFLTGLQGLAEYLELLERHDMIQCDGCWAKPRWFQMDMRKPGLYRAVLYGEGDCYRFSYMLAADEFDTEPLIEGMRLAYDRLKAVYERFFDTAI